MTDAQRKSVAIELTAQQRLQLISTLNQLPLSKFLKLEYTLNTPKEIMPGVQEALGVRSSRLLEWAEGTTGCGLEVLLDALALIGIRPFDKSSGAEKINKSKKSKLKVKLKGNFDELDEEEVRRLTLEFRNLAKQSSIEIKWIREGSIELELEGSEEALNRLKALIESGEITQIGGQNVERVFSVRPKIEGLWRFDLRGTNLSGADLSGVDLRGANLGEANLTEVNFRGADLTEASLRGADLRGADLRGTNLSGADLSGVKLRGADLIRADLIRADLIRADLIEADLILEPTSGAQTPVGPASLEPTSFWINPQWGRPQRS